MPNGSDRVVSHPSQQNLSYVRRRGDWAVNVTADGKDSSVYALADQCTIIDDPEPAIKTLADVPVGVWVEIPKDVEDRFDLGSNVVMRTSWANAVVTTAGDQALFYISQDIPVTRVIGTLEVGE